MQAFAEKVIIFVTTAPVDIKPSTCPANGRHASVCKFSPSRFAVVRRGVKEEIGLRQNKQTLKYLIDFYDFPISRQSEARDGRSVGRTDRHGATLSAVLCGGPTNNRG